MLVETSALDRFKGEPERSLCLRQRRGRIAGRGWRHFAEDGGGVGVFVRVGMRRVQGFLDDLAHRHEASPATRAAAKAFVDGARRARGNPTVRRIERRSNRRVAKDVTRTYNHLDAEIRTRRA